MSPQHILPMPFGLLHGPHLILSPCTFHTSMVTLTPPKGCNPIVCLVNILVLIIILIIIIMCVFIVDEA
jgi:hypothetical protein